MQVNRWTIETVLKEYSKKIYDYNMDISRTQGKIMGSSINISICNNSEKFINIYKIIINILSLVKIINYKMKEKM